MPYAVSHDPVQDLVEVKFVGLVSGDDLRKATTECVALQRSTGAMRFLIDVNESELKASTLDIYDIPGKQYLDEGVDRRSRFAVILPDAPRPRKAAYFYEAACRNRGWNARVLPDHESALEWLTGAQ